MQDEETSKLPETSMEEKRPLKSGICPEVIRSRSTLLSTAKSGP